MHKRNAFSAMTPSSGHLDVAEFGQLEGNLPPHLPRIPGIPYQPQFSEWKKKGLPGDAKVELERFDPPRHRPRGGRSRQCAGSRLEPQLLGMIDSP